MQRFAAELGSSAERAEFEKSWRSGPDLHAESKVELALAGRRVSMVVYSDIANPWPLLSRFPPGVQGTDPGRAQLFGRLPALPAKAAAAAAARALGLGTGFVDIQRATVEIGPVQSGDGFLALGVVGHFDESKAPGLTRIAISDDVYTPNRAIRREKGTDRILRRPKAEISYKDVLHPLEVLS
jgi:hypothetical protein